MSWFIVNGGKGAALDFMIRLLSRASFLALAIPAAAVPFEEPMTFHRATTGGNCVTWSYG